MNVCKGSYRDGIEAAARLLEGLHAIGKHRVFAAAQVRALLDVPTLDVPTRVKGPTPAHRRLVPPLPAETIACPKCAAPAGEGCISRPSGWATSMVHEARSSAHRMRSK